MAAVSSGSPGFGRPLQLQDYLNAAQRALAAGDQMRALAIAGEAAEKGFEHPNLLTLAVYHHLNLGRFGDALGLATRARELAPRNVDVLNALGTVLVRQNRPRDALPVFDAALRQAPGQFITHFNKANALELASELRRARDQFLRALSLQPGHAETMARIAHLASQRGDAAEAREYGGRALRLDPNQFFASFALAAVETADKNYAAAEQFLLPVLRNPNASPNVQAIAHSMMGDVLDGLQRPAEAFAAYTRAGDGFRAVYAPQFIRPGLETALARAQRLTAFFRDADPAPWRAVSTGTYTAPVRAHVFLVGFPRSGTTLLEQVLAAHPDVVAMDERNCLVDAYEFVLEAGGLERLAALDGAALDPWRARYWKRVAEAGFSPARPVFIDKMPLNSVLLCLIAKLFPDAKILFALRDPRDVVFSCFRRRFGMTQQMFELLTLEGTAAYYDAVMTLSDLYRGVLKLPVCDTRYEDLVTDFTGETARLCAFLGLAPDPGMADFAPKAQARNIDTPSAAQVAQGLFTQGAGQWRAYEVALKPVMATLSPWLARYGYKD